MNLLSDVHCNPGSPHSCTTTILEANMLFSLLISINNLNNMFTPRISTSEKIHLILYESSTPVLYLKCIHFRMTSTSFLTLLHEEGGSFVRRLILSHFNQILHGAQRDRRMLFQEYIHQSTGCSCLVLCTLTLLAFTRGVVLYHQLLWVVGKWY